MLNKRINPLFVFAFFGVYLIMIMFFSLNQVEAKGEETVILYEDTKKINLDQSIEILEDDNQGYTIDDMTSGRFDHQFEPYTEIGSPNYGYTTSVYWVRFDVQDLSEKRQWLLEVSYPPLNHITLYVPSTSQDYEARDMGGAYPFDQREIFHRNFVYDLDTLTNEAQTLYLRFETEGGMQFPLTLWNSSNFPTKLQIEFILLGLFYGITIALGLYNLFLYFSLRHRSYLYYVLVIVSMIFLNFTLNGLAYQFIWPEFSWWNMRSILFSMGVSNMCALLFTRSFLDIRVHLPRFKLVFNILIGLNVLNICILFFSYVTALNMMFLITLMTIFTILGTAFLCLRKGIRPARYFFIAWIIFLIGASISLLADAGVLPITFTTKYIEQFAYAVEVILLSFALADKINIIRTEKETAERMAKESQALVVENLKETDQLKDEFLAMTSHELRTPLNGIIGIAETLQSGAAGKVSEGVRRHLSMIVLSGERLSDLINDILDFSKLKNNDLHIDPKPVRVQECIDVVLTICEPLVKNKSITLNNQVKSNTPLILADENRLQQILYNLIGNAIKYTDRGEVTISAKRMNDYLEITVSDTGKGIPFDHLDVIFEPFHQETLQLVREAGGTGIGLSVTKRLVNLHHGEITVASEVGLGSQFSFTIPISHGRNHIKDEAAATTTTPTVIETEDTQMISTSIMVPDKKDATVLIADDEIVNLQVLQNQLVLAGYNVITTSDGKEALDKVRENNVDLLILDIMMPKMSGYEVSKTLREEYTLSELPILMLTARNQTQDIVTSFENGANDYLSKPCNKQELLSRVKTLVQLRWLNEKLTRVNQSLEKKIQKRTQALTNANTNLTKTNNQLKGANQELIEMAKSRRELLANIAHELGTPVTLIHSYVQAVQEGLIQANQTRYLEMVYHKALILDRLIHDLSDLSKLEGGQIDLEMVRMCLRHWIEQVVEKLDFDVKQNGRRFIKPETNDLSILDGYICAVDIGRMDQVFSNLMRNAIKYTASLNGKITMSVELAESTEEVIIKMRDNGEGMSESMLPHIFDRLYKSRKKPAQGESDGTGLGLAIVKEIMMLHKGRVWATSQLKKGSTFSIALPVHRENG